MFGVWVWTTGKQPGHDADSSLSLVTCSWVFITSGTSAMFVGLVGCCGIICGSRRLLTETSIALGALSMSVVTYSLYGNLHLSWRDIPWQAISIAVGIMTFSYNYRETKKKETRRNRLNHINEQLSKLYGPLYGNRLSNRKSYLKAIKGHTNLRDYLQVAKSQWQNPQTRDEGIRMLNRWRKFLFYITHLLDVKAEETIRDNAHLFEYGVEEAGLFQNFIFHVNYEKLIVASWREGRNVSGIKEAFQEEDFVRDNNAGKSDDKTSKMLTDLVEQVRETYATLVARQQKLMREIDEAAG
ncbi:Hypp7281 [Branchiostoma lanceolatum]|uniref:Hypp7281 protein n=1 Tax=Branchiostoma lanceolatum TaxID=7740 RepID=A0A8J9YYW3_BRALA|nr:Hypp7281 [Branchiostoma lanceolatum]